MNLQMEKVLDNYPTKEYLKTFQKYLERMQLCINNRGNYLNKNDVNLFNFCLFAYKISIGVS